MRRRPAPEPPEPGSWRAELDAFARAFSGAFLFAIPLLFTMEMWWLGEHTGAPRLLAVLAIALVANCGLAHAAGFRRRTSFWSSAEQAVDAVAVGLVGSVIVLLALNRLRPDDPLDRTLAKVILQALPLSLGASAANAVFARGQGRAGGTGGDGERSQRGNEEEASSPSGSPSSSESAWQPLLNDLGATVTGGVFLGFSIAPTEEVPMLAAGMTTLHLLGLIALTLAITYCIVFVSGFDPEQTHGRPEGPFQSPLTETALAYLVSLLIAAGAVVLFGHAEPGDPLHSMLTQTLVLAVPTAIGGAAGRLVI